MGPPQILPARLQWQNKQQPPISKYTSGPEASTHFT